NRLDITARYPELAALRDALSGHSAVLDGEIVALDASGRPSFERMQSRIHLRSDLAARPARSTPGAYMLFDVLYLDGHDLMSEGYEHRRDTLEKLSLSGPRWQTPPAHAGAGREMLDVARQMGLEGVIAKRAGSAYLPGVRSDSW